MFTSCIYISLIQLVLLSAGSNLFASVILIALLIVAISLTVALILLYRKNLSLRREFENRVLESEEQKIKLEKLNKTKDKLFSIIAHDLKNPLNSIIGFTDLLQEKYKDITDNQRIKYIDTIHKASKLTYELLNNLFEWARSQTGTLNFNPKQLSLLAIVLECSEVLSIYANNKNIIFNVDIDSSETVYADANMIKIVLRNLLSNSIKFSVRGASIKIKAQSTGKYCEVSIIDQGLGIEEDRLNNIFEFHEFSSLPGTENESGTGLGLVICKEFVEKNGGEIKVKSKPNEGSTFFFTIPKSKIS